MFDNNNFIKENKRVLAIMGSIVVVAIVALVVFNIINNSDEQDFEEEVSNGVVNPYKLPELSSISLTQQPTLYDFVNGSLGLHEDLLSITTPTPYFTFIAKDGSSQLYVVMNYGHQSEQEMKNLLPILSSSPIRVDLNEVEFNGFINDIDLYDELGNINSVNEGDYTFYAIPYSVMMLDDSFNMIDYDWIISKYEPGILSEEINNGMGIPTEIIRDKCDLQAIKNASNIDFNDTFWDNVNYNTNIKVYNRSDRTDYCVISPIYKPLVAGYGEPLYMFTVNGNDLMMTVENLNNYLIENGYESIDEALETKDYATSHEVEEKQDVNISIH